MRTAKVLFFAADPRSIGGGGSPRLQLDEEVREIRLRVDTAWCRDDLDFDTRWAARPGDLVQALEETRPRIVHFSGHCGPAGLVLAGALGSRGHSVSARALAQLFAVYPGEIRVVVLNACLSLPQAEAIANVVGCAIGTLSEITDAAAITFSSSLYGAIARGDSVQAAFDKARTALAMEHAGEEECPQLVVRPGVDARKLFLVKPRRRRTVKWMAAGVVGAGLAGGTLLQVLEDPYAACAWAPAVSASTGPSAGAAGALSALDSAKADYEAGRYDRAFPRFQRLGLGKNAEALAFAGDMILRGQGTKAFPDSGMSWLRRAASWDDPRAMTLLAAAYKDGYGERRSDHLVRHWYQRAAEKHWAEALRQLGELNLDAGETVTALNRFREAVTAGSLDARVDAGLLYEHGQGTPRDLRMAVCLYRTAAEAGLLRGMLSMGQSYQNGIGVSRDDETAAEWYQKAAARGSDAAMLTLGEMYMSGQGVPRDSARAERWFQRAQDARQRNATTGAVTRRQE